jgi:predicted GNAT family acetyltransferase
MNAVEDNKNASRFEVTVDGLVAFLDYERTANELAILHTEVPPALRRRGLGSLLAKTAIGVARAEGLRLKVLCPFVQAYRRTHPDP